MTTSADSVGSVVVARTLGVDALSDGTEAGNDVIKGVVAKATVDVSAGAGTKEG